jgi:hypothetical protein
MILTNHLQRGSLEKEGSHFLRAPWDRARIRILFSPSLFFHSRFFCFLWTMCNADWWNMIPKLVSLGTQGFQCIKTISRSLMANMHFTWDKTLLLAGVLPSFWSLCCHCSLEVVRENQCESYSCLLSIPRSTLPPSSLDEGQLHFPVFLAGDFWVTRGRPEEDRHLRFLLWPGLSPLMWLCVFSGSHFPWTVPPFWSNPPSSLHWGPGSHWWLQCLDSNSDISFLFQLHGWQWLCAPATLYPEWCFSEFLTSYLLYLEYLQCFLFFWLDPNRATGFPLVNDCGKLAITSEIQIWVNLLIQKPGLQKEKYEEEVKGPWQWKGCRGTFPWSFCS